MKKTKIAAAALAAVMSVSMLPQTTALPSLGVTASAASTSSKLAAPTGIKTSVSETQIKLSWNEVDGADAYIIYKYNSSIKKYEQYKSVTGTTCTVKELTAGTKYYFKVAALVKVNGKYTVQTKSAAVSATTAKASSKLAAPAGIKTSVSENKIQLSWNKVSGADAYIIYKYDSATKTLKQYKSVTGTTCTVTGLTAGTKYYFKVAALVKTNGKYTVQTKSNYVSATTKASSKLAAPTGIKSAVSESQIKLSWNEVDGADAYIIYKYNNSTKKYEQYKSVFGTNCTVKDLAAGTKYNFKVAALVKVNGKYTAQTESSVVSATTTKKVQVPSSLSDFEIENGVLKKYVGNGGDVVIPDSVTSIEGFAFSGCTSLTSVTIPNSVTSIGILAFYGCPSLTSVTIGNSVASIGYNAFSSCTSLANISVSNGNNTYVDVDGVLFSKDKTKLIKYPGAKSTASYVVLDGVISIEGGAFSNCAFLTSVTIPDSVTDLGISSTKEGDSCAFRDCPALKSINVSKANNTYADVDGVLFSKDKTTLILYPGAKSAASYTIPNGVVYIRDGAFSDCTYLTSITIPDSINSTMGGFNGCTSLKSIKIPDSVKNIGAYAFMGCTSLTSVTIPDSVTGIYTAAFKGCTSLTNITIPNSVTSIDGCAFQDCTSLKSIKIPNGVTSIDIATFQNCTSLTSVTIPDSVTFIESGAFRYCESIKATYKGKTYTYDNIDDLYSAIWNG